MRERKAEQFPGNLEFVLAPLFLSKAARSSETLVSCRINPENLELPKLIPITPAAITCRSIALVLVVLASLKTSLMFSAFIVDLRT